MYLSLCDYLCLPIADDLFQILFPIHSIMGKSPEPQVWKAHTQTNHVKEKQMLRSVSINCDKVFTSAQPLGWSGGGAEGDRGS